MVRRLLIIGGVALAAALWFRATDVGQPEAPTIAIHSGERNVTRRDSIDASRTTAPVIVPKAPATRENAYAAFQSSGDLFGLYKRLAASTDAKSLYVAWQLLRECSQISLARNVYVTASRGEIHFVANAPLAPKQVDAATEMVRRCGGFSGWQSGSFRVESGVLERRLGNLTTDEAEIVNAMLGHRPPSTSAVRASIEDADPCRLHMLVVYLLDRWIEGVAVKPSEDQRNVAYLALSLMRCDLGADCSSTSLLALNGCFWSAAACGWTVQEQGKRFLKTEEVADFDRYRAMFLTAIQDRDFALFGL